MGLFRNTENSRAEKAGHKDGRRLARADAKNGTPGTSDTTLEQQYWDTAGAPDTGSREKGGRLMGYRTETNRHTR